MRAQYLEEDLPDSRVTNPKLVETVWGPTDTPYVADPSKPERATKVTAMTPADIERFVGHYRQAALNSIEAGFDGVEIHGANGYVRKPTVGLC